MEVPNLNSFVGLTLGVIIIKPKTIDNTMGIFLSKYLLHFFLKVLILKLHKFRNVSSKLSSYVICLIVQITISYLEFEILN